MNNISLPVLIDIPKIDNLPIINSQQIQTPQLRMESLPSINRTGKTTTQVTQVSNLGGYSKVESRTQAWLATPVTTDVKTGKSKSKAKTPQVTNPTFDVYSNIETDPEWIERFRGYSLGSMPRGITFKQNLDNMGGILSGKKSNKIQRLELSPNVEEGLSECKEFLVKMGISPTQLDNQKTKEIIEENYRKQVENRPTRWASIRQAKVKAELLNSYYNELARHLGYNDEQKRIMISDISSGFLLGQLNNDNVIINDGIIINITDIEYDHQNKRVHLVNPVKLKKQVKTQQAPPSSPFAESWKYLIYYVDSKNIQTKNTRGLSSNLQSQFPSQFETTTQTYTQTHTKTDDYTNTRHLAIKSSDGSLSNLERNLSNIKIVPKS